ncbi:MAG: hypothetical protein M1829_004208 [Trizodia sp. TS-e1964]|nr:MAG: hypothetical protein M1829_004208 [Trizodia sp. TS-e1964]
MALVASAKGTTKSGAQNVIPPPGIGNGDQFYASDGFVVVKFLCKPGRLNVYSSGNKIGCISAQGKIESFSKDCVDYSVVTLRDEPSNIVVYFEEGDLGPKFCNLPAVGPGQNSIPEGFYMSCGERGYTKDKRWAIRNGELVYKNAPYASFGALKGLDVVLQTEGPYHIKCEHGV